MLRDLAALYVSMPAAEFEQAIANGELPQPRLIGRKERWLRSELDAHLDRLTGDARPDWRQNSKLYGKDEAA